MSTHFVVIESVTGATTESAVIEASSLGGGEVSVAVRNRSGTLVTSFSLPSNADHFTTTETKTANLFSLTDNQSALVVITSEADMSVILRHSVTTQGHTVVRSVSVPKASDARASTIVFPTGAVGTGAHAMVLNPKTAPIEVTLRYGSLTTSPVSATTVAGNGFSLIPITTENANAILQSGTDFMAQYLVKLGGNPFTESYLVP